MPAESTVQRVCLGLSRPVLESAAGWLIERGGAAGAAREVDLAGWTVVTPGSRAKRVLLAMLVDACDRRGVGLTPPRLITPGDLGAMLIPVEGAAAGEAERLLAWAAALRGSEAAGVRALVPAWPERGSFAAWLGLAEMLEGWRRALAGEGLRMRDVAPVGARMPDWPDAERWAVLEELEARYGAALAGAGLVDAEWARADVLAGRRAAAAGREVGPMVLVGLAGLRGVARRAVLRHASERPGMVTALIAADEREMDGFDEAGALRTEAWLARPACVPREAVRFAGGPREQAEAAVACLAGYAETAEVGAMVVGLADAGLAGHLEQAALRLAGRPVHVAGGRGIGGSEPVVLLEAVAALADRPTFAALAAVARLPAVEAWLQARSPREHPAWWLAGLDQYLADAVAEQVEGAPPPRSGERAAVEFVVDGVGALLAGLGPLATREPRALGAWADEAIGLLERLFGERRVRRRDAEDRVLLDACAALAESAAGLIEVPAGLEPGPVRAGEALRALLALAGERASPGEVDGRAIEAVGWLELPLDPAAVAVVVGMNDGCVPGRSNADGLLTESLRGALGMETSEDRRARDRAALHVLVRTKREVLFIAGRHDAAGEALWPSRFVLEADSAAEPAHRVRWFLGKGPGPETPVVPGRARAADVDGFPVRPVVPTAAVTELPVTAFRDYLASPYRFYLRHVARLKEWREPGRELEAAPFGNLLHAVLAGFSRSDAAGSTDPGEIEDACVGWLRRLAPEWVGSRPGLVTVVQLDRAALRLRDFAFWQARRRAAGWTIRHAEWQPDAAAVFDVDGVGFGLKGRIDRLDYHEASKRWAVIDYKTGDQRADPVKAHRKGDQWVDLQLPLYRHLALGLTGTLEVELGYFVLPADPGSLDAGGGRRAAERIREPRDSGFLVAAFTGEDLASADERAREVVRAVRRGAFDEVGDVPRGTGSVALLCGAGLVEAHGAGDGDGDGGDGDEAGGGA